MEYTTAYYVDEKYDRHSEQGFVLVQLIIEKTPICLAGWAEREPMQRMTDKFFTGDIKRVVNNPDKWFQALLTEYQDSCKRCAAEGLVLAAVGSEFLLAGEQGQAFALYDFFGKGNADLLHMEYGFARGRIEAGAGILLLDATKKTTGLQRDSLEIVEKVNAYKAMLGESLYIKKRLTEERAEKHLRELADYSEMQLRRAILLYAQGADHFGD